VTPGGVRGHRDPVTFFAGSYSSDTTPHTRASCKEIVREVFSV
jgi:hypothetical protein